MQLWDGAGEGKVEAAAAEGAKEGLNLCLDFFLKKNFLGKNTARKVVFYYPFHGAITVRNVFLFLY